MINENEDKEQEEYLKKWTEKQKIKKKRRKERIEKIKNFIKGEK